METLYEHSERMVLFIGGVVDGQCKRVRGMQDRVTMMEEQECTFSPMVGQVAIDDSLIKITHYTIHPLVISRTYRARSDVTIWYAHPDDMSNLAAITRLFNNYKPKKDDDNGKG